MGEISRKQDFQYWGKADVFKLYKSLTKIQIGKRGHDVFV